MRSFETTTKLLPYQDEAVRKLRPVRLSALLMEMGTGKSRTVIELAKYRAHKIDKVVWFCPVSLKLTVLGEILKHTDCKRSDVCVFDDVITQTTIPDAMWYVVGIESLSQSARVILATYRLITENTFVILDESTYCKTHHAKRTMRITHFSRHAKYRAIMTGTMLDNGVKDMFAQFYFLSPKILGYESFYSFAANHLEYSDKYPGMVVRAHNLEYLAAKIAPYSYQVTKDEVLDLPHKKYNTHYFDMTDEQRWAYELEKESMLEEMMMYDRIDRLSIFRLFSTLQQIASGFQNINGRIIEYENHRLDTLLEAIPDDEQVVIWAKFHYDIERINRALRESYGDKSVALYYGKTPVSKRKIEEDRFHSGEARFFLATPGTGGHGLTLTESARILVYNRTFKYAENIQMEDRCHRIGQTRSPLYTDIHCTNSIDDRIWRAYMKKGNLIDEFEREVDKVKKEGLRELIKSL